MFYFRLFATSVRSLDTNFLRSLLATLGVLIGVSSVVACMSIMEGFSNDFARRFKSLGSNVLYLVPASVKIHGSPVGAAQTLKLRDIRILKRELAGEIEDIAPEAFSGALVKHFDKFKNATVLATSEAYFKIHDFKLKGGREMERGDAIDDSNFDGWLGNGIADSLFGGTGGIGQTVKINGKGYRVMGVMQKRGNLGFLNADNTVFIPIANGLKRFLNQDYLNRMTIVISQPEKADELEKKIKQAMRKAHKIRAGAKDDFETFRSDQMLTTVTEILFIWKIVFYSMVGIGLLVAGIGIMNIMLVSVTERTREIGVRMAVGARRSDIMLQFLVEALVISLVGGGCGLLLGLMFSDLLEQVFQDTGMFRIEITTFVVATALITSTVVGVFSGLYPAYKASRLDPVEALRYE